MKRFWVQCGFLTVLIGAISSLSCNRPAHNYVYHPQESGASGIQQPKVLFLTFFMRRDGDVATLELRDKQAVDGTLKQAPEDSNGTDRLYVAQLRKDRSEISGFYIEHPLRKHVEFVNESNAPEMRQVQLTEAEFFVRSILDPACVYLRVDEVQENRVINSFVFEIR